MKETWCYNYPMHSSSLGYLDKAKGQHHHFYVFIFFNIYIYIIILFFGGWPYFETQHGPAHRKPAPSAERSAHELWRLAGRQRAIPEPAMAKSSIHTFSAPEIGAARPAGFPLNRAKQWMDKILHL